MNSTLVIQCAPSLRYQGQSLFSKVRGGGNISRSGVKLPVNILATDSVSVFFPDFARASRATLSNFDLKLLGFIHPEYVK